MNRSVIIVAVAAGIVISLNAIELSTAKLTLRVVGEDGRPVPGIDAGVTFERPRKNPGAWGSVDSLTRSGKTDAAGLFVAEDRGGLLVHYGAGSEGYYKSHGTIEFKTEKDGRYQPWNPTVDVVVKKIIRPIPMFARRLETDIPVLNEPVGFDLIESDWVAPNGRGKVADFIFKITKRVVSFDDFSAELILSFSNPGDGIARMPSGTGGDSELRSPHQAPDGGYSGSLSLLKGNSIERGRYGFNEDREDYFLRVRTITDERGEIVSALYGKIYGRVEYFPVSNKPATIRFTYYLNASTNDRNVEFDPKRNLLRNLEELENPTAP